MSEEVLAPPQATADAAGAHQYRYPGAPPFRDTDIDRRLFRGRASESDIVLHGILSSDLFLLYAESGLGKSSLLNAGVAGPLRERGHWPVSIRMNDVGADPLRSIADQILEVASVDDTVEVTFEPVVQEAGGVDGETPEDDVPGTLWDLLGTLEVWRGTNLLRPVLIFDQFEELFTLDWPAEVRQRFIVEFGEVVRGHPMDPAAHLTPRPDVRLVVVVREDSLGELEAMADHVPGIMKNRFRLGGLDPDQAEAAIREPGLVEDERIDTSRIAYTQGAAQEILAFLRTRTVRGEEVTVDTVDPSQLQILCQYVERSIVPTKQPDESGVVLIDRPDLGGRAGLDRVLSDFYRRTIEMFPAERRRDLREMCETGLVNRQGRRLSREQDEIELMHGVTRAELSQLVDQRLLRAEPRLGSTYYELAHDTLVGAVLADREQRRLAARRRRSRRLGVAAASVVVILLALLGLVAWNASQDSEAADSPPPPPPPPPPPTVPPTPELTTDGADGTVGDGEFLEFVVSTDPDPFVVVAEPVAGLDVAIEVTDDAGNSRRQNQVGPGEAEHMVVVASEDSPAALSLRVSSVAGAGVVDVAPQRIDVQRVEPGTELKGTLDPGEVRVYELSDPGGFVSVESPSDTDLTLEVLTGARRGELIDAGGPGLPELLIADQQPVDLIAVRGKNTLGEISIRSDSIAARLTVTDGDVEFSGPLPAGAVVVVDGLGSGAAAIRADFVERDGSVQIDETGMIEDGPVIEMHPPGSEVSVIEPFPVGAGLLPGRRTEVALRVITLDEYWGGELGPQTSTGDRRVRVAVAPEFTTDSEDGPEDGPVIEVLSDTPQSGSILGLHRLPPIRADEVADAQSDGGSGLDADPIPVGQVGLTGVDPGPLRLLEAISEVPYPLNLFVGEDEILAPLGGRQEFTPVEFSDDVRYVIVTSEGDYEIALLPPTELPLDRIEEPIRGAGLFRIDLTEVGEQQIAERQIEIEAPSGDWNLVVDEGEGALPYSGQPILIGCDGPTVATIHVYSYDPFAEASLLVDEPELPCVLSAVRDFVLEAGGNLEMATCVTDSLAEDPGPEALEELGLQDLTPAGLAEARAAAVMCDIPEALVDQALEDAAVDQTLEAVEVTSE